MVSRASVPTSSSSSRRGQVQADVELGEHVAGQAQGGGQAQVDPGGAVADHVGVDPLGLPGEQADGADAVAAQVAEGAAAELDRASDVALLDADAEGGPHRGQPTDGPFGASLRARVVWGWWRHIKPSTQRRPAASAASKQRAVCIATGRAT